MANRKEALHVGVCFDEMPSAGSAGERRKGDEGKDVNREKKEIEYQTGIGVVFFSQLLNEWDRFYRKNSTHKEYEWNADEVNRQEPR